MAKTVKNRTPARSSKKQPNFKTRTAFSSKQLLVFAAIFGVIIGVAAWHSFAAPVALQRLEGENMTPDGQPAIAPVADPAASGGKAMEMLSNNSAMSQSFSISGKVKTVTFRVHATACQGSDSLMAAYIDNILVTTPPTAAGQPWVTVTNTDWMSLEYKAPVSLGSGPSHVLTIRHALKPHIDTPCNNPLFVDYVDVTGGTTPT